MTQEFPEVSITSIAPGPGLSPPTRLCPVMVSRVSRRSIAGLPGSVKAGGPGLSPVVVRDLRVARASVTAEDLAALQTDVLAVSCWPGRRCVLRQGAARHRQGHPAVSGLGAQALLPVPPCYKAEIHQMTGRVVECPI